MCVNVLLSLRVYSGTRNFQHVGGARIVIMSHASYDCKQYKMATAMTEETDALTKRLGLAEALLSKAAGFRCGGKIQGMQRVEKQIKAEMSMLNKVVKEESIIIYIIYIAINQFYLCSC